MNAQQTTKVCPHCKTLAEYKKRFGTGFYKSYTLELCDKCLDTLFQKAKILKPREETPCDT